jgi:hypothetical protein
MARSLAVALLAGSKRAEVAGDHRSAKSGDASRSEAATECAGASLQSKSAANPAIAVAGGNHPAQFIPG